MTRQPSTQRSAPIFRCSTTLRAQSSSALSSTSACSFCSRQARHWSACAVARSVSRRSRSASSRVIRSSSWWRASSASSSGRNARPAPNAGSHARVPRAAQQPRLPGRVPGLGQRIQRALRKRAVALGVVHGDQPVAQQPVDRLVEAGALAHVDDFVVSARLQLLQHPVGMHRRSVSVARTASASGDGRLVDMNSYSISSKNITILNQTIIFHKGFSRGASASRPGRRFPSSRDRARCRNPRPNVRRRTGGAIR